MATIPIPDSAFSYIETDVAELADDPEGYDLTLDEYKSLKTVMIYVDMENQTLRVPTMEGDRLLLADAFNDLSNVIDETIESGRSDNVKFDSNARRAFGTLASKMRKAQ